MYIDELIKTLNKFNKENINKINELKEKILKTKLNNGIVYLVGNGGSSSIASHVSTDLLKACKIKSKTFHDVNLITCYSNDYGYEFWLSKAIEDVCNKDDLLIAISSSGNSKNIINAAKAMKKIGADVFTLTGFEENNQLKIENNGIWIDSNNYNIVEATHLVILLDQIELLAIK
jgi:D-sedoheptulose 7-phosphate isomerase